LHDDAWPDALFGSARGQLLHHHALHSWGTRLGRPLAIAPPHGGRGPCLMSFRPTCAVTWMPRWYEQGQDVPALRPPLGLPRAQPTPGKWLVPHRGAGVAARCGTAVPAVCDGRPEPWHL